jgi:hypothetical protein
MLREVALRWMDCFFSSAKPSHPMSTIRCPRWDGWREKLFGSMARSKELLEVGGETC